MPIFSEGMEFAMVMQETKPTGEDIAKKDADVSWARMRKR